MKRLKTSLPNTISKLYLFFKPLKCDMHRLFGILRLANWRSQLGTLGLCSVIYPHVVIHNPDKVKIGKNVAIAEFTHIWGGGGVVIGDDTIIASHVIISSMSHDRNARLYRESLVYKPVIIKQGVWIGSGAIILPGVTIGEGCIVGAGSVVTRNLKPFSMTMGRLIKVVKFKNNIVSQKPEAIGVTFTDE